MFGIWMNVVCLKCGNNEEKKYFVNTLDNLEKFHTIKCACGNEDCEHFKLLEIDFSEGKQI